MTVRKQYDNLFFSFFHGRQSLLGKNSMDTVRLFSRLIVEARKIVALRRTPRIQVSFLTFSAVSIRSFDQLPVAQSATNATYARLKERHFLGMAKGGGRRIWIEIELEKITGMYVLCAHRIYHNAHFEQCRKVLVHWFLIRVPRRQPAVRRLQEFHRGRKRNFIRNFFRQCATIAQ